MQTIPGVIQSGKCSEMIKTEDFEAYWENIHSPRDLEGSSMGEDTSGQDRGLGAKKSEGMEQDLVTSVPRDEREAHSRKDVSLGSPSKCLFCDRMLTKDEYLTHFKVRIGY